MIFKRKKEYKVGWMEGVESVMSWERENNITEIHCMKYFKRTNIDCDEMENVDMFYGP